METMTQENSERPSRHMTPQQQAGLVAERLEELILLLDEARQEEGKTPPSQRAIALTADVISLAKGVKSGAVQQSQPRMASNLIEVAAELDKCGHSRLAWSFTAVIEGLSVNGLAAENCSLGRTRIGPTTP